MASQTETLAYVTCLVCIFVDVMGQFFTQPALIPYASHLGADTYQAGVLITGNMFGRVVSNQLLPWLSDKTSRKGTVVLSIVGSFVAYAMCASANYVDDDATLLAAAANSGNATKTLADSTNGFKMLFGGKLVGGLFGATVSLVQAYVIELSVYDPVVLKTRQTMVMAMNMATPMVLSPIGGAVAAFGLEIPFWVSTATAFCGFFFALRYMHDIDEVRAVEAAERKKNEAIKHATGDITPSGMVEMTPVADSVDVEAGVDEKPIGFSAPVEAAEEAPGPTGKVENPEKPPQAANEQDEASLKEEVVSGNPCSDPVMIELSCAYFLFGTSITMVGLTPFNAVFTLFKHHLPPYNAM